MTTKTREEALAGALKAWQEIEIRSQTQAAHIMASTRSPVIRLVMEIIQRDSALHHRVQQFILDSLEREALHLTVDDVADVWEAVQRHIDAERATGELINAARDALAGTRDVVQQFLLSYLASDERKHDRLLDDLEAVKRGMYRSA